jgi:glutaminyl-tRNA synthetase
MSNFLTDIIEADLASGRHRSVVTRFPPEPNGYLHIGHAKSICTNFGLARQYGGRCHLRFDDTNPLTEDVEYVESIQADVRWLGFDWGEHLYFASDYFERFFQLAVRLIEKGLAYVDEQPVEAIRAQRGTLTEPGTPSPFRDRTVEENLRCFAAMRDGQYPDGGAVLRARIDMAASNMIMRDPLLYRVRHAHHHRTGDAWCIYPMYDYAHCLEDAIEAVTHSICTLEFENNRELYDWVIEHTEIECQPRQYEFARLNLGFTVMSKRKLLQLVEGLHVSGWDDPRMPTLAGLRRRGVTPSAIRAFADLIGVARANSSVDIGKLEFCIRDDLNATAPRVLCVTRPLKVTLTTWPEDHVEWLDAPYWPEDIGLPGSRPLPMTRTLLIEQEDFAESPPKGWHRLSPGAEVRLRHGYVVRCDEVVKNDAGEVVELRCSHDPATRSGDPDGRRVKGVIHWVSATLGVPVEVRNYDRLFSVERPDADPDADFRAFLNPESLVRCPDAVVEPSVMNDSLDQRYQFERRGFFWADPVESTPEGRVFNRIVTLKDSWARAQATPEPAKPAPAAAPARRADADARPVKRTRAQERALARSADAALQSAMDALVAAGFSSDDADVLTGHRSTAELMLAALPQVADAALLARWGVNDLMRLSDEGDLSASRLDAAGLVAVLDGVQSGRLTVAAGRLLLETLHAKGGDAATHLATLGLDQPADAAGLQAHIHAVLEAHPDEVARYRAGKVALLGFLTGQVMRRAGAGADAAAVRTQVAEALGG